MQTMHEINNALKEHQFGSVLLKFVIGIIN